nr:uncharacterized protein LOC117840418 [Setaria viridis]
MMLEDLSMDEVMAQLKRFFKHVRRIWSIVREHYATNSPNQALVVVQKVIEEEEEEKEEESEDWSSFSRSNSEAAEKFVIKPRLSDKSRSSFGTSKREAKDDLEVGLAPPPKKTRTSAAKQVVKKSSINEVPPSIITFEEGQVPEDRVHVSCFPFCHA